MRINQKVQTPVHVGICRFQDVPGRLDWSMSFVGLSRLLLRRAGRSDLEELCGVKMRTQLLASLRSAPLGGAPTVATFPFFGSCSTQGQCAL